MIKSKVCLIYQLKGDADFLVGKSLHTWIIMLLLITERMVAYSPLGPMQVTEDCGVRRKSGLNGVACAL